jgi:hemolysin activation/secretion protein
MSMSSYFIRKTFTGCKIFMLVVAALILFSGSIFSTVMALEETENATFDIYGFTVEGNTILTEGNMLDVLKSFTGRNKSGSDVEKARVALEECYHKRGYPAVQVGVPEQTVEDGLVRLRVIENKIMKVHVKGNKYFTRESILKRFPSLLPGNDIYLPRLIQEFGLANRNQDMKISPVMKPGKEPGTIDIELTIKDKLPLHGGLEVNNRSSHNTTALRVNGSLRYDNLWQKEHSISVQYQTSPEDTDEVTMLAESYVFPATWNTNHMVALYGVWSDSDTSVFGEGVEVIGKGFIYGARYIIPLPSLEKYYHNVTIGVDYKHFNEDVNFTDGEEEGLKTPITYLPFLFSYSATESDSLGKTQFSLGLNWAFRNMVTDQREFEIKRYRARGDYLYMTTGIERSSKLPLDMGLYTKLDGQLASEPLISNEQYTAGGMESVRGYKESAASGDYAIHGTAELTFPELLGSLGVKKPVNATVYYFYDIAKIWKKVPLPGEDKSVTLQGAGSGVKGTLFNKFEYNFEWAMALRDTDNVQSGKDTCYFRLKYAF